MNDSLPHQPHPAQSNAPTLLPQAQPPPQVVDATPTTSPELDRPEVSRQLRIYSHSSFFYWWPVWVVGYFLAFLTYWLVEPQPIDPIGHTRVWIHPSSNLGLAYFSVLFLVILITNFSVRGLASGLVIMGIALATVILAFVGWWDEIFSWFGGLTIHLTMGAYFWFSTLMFLTWAVTVFGLDRIRYWEVTPGQLTQKSLFGAGSKSYN